MSPFPKVQFEGWMYYSDYETYSNIQYVCTHIQITSKTLHCIINFFMNINGKPDK